MSTPGAARSTVGGAVVREGREGVVAVAGGDADDVGEVVVARVGGRGVVVGAVVAGRDDEQRARAPPRWRRARRARSGAAERGVDHPRAVARGVGVGGDDVGDVAAAVVAEHAKRHQGRGPAHAGHSGGVIAARRDGARDVGAVAVAVLRLRVLVDEVPAVHVVDAPVAVVVEAVGLAPAARLARVRPQVGAEVWMRWRRSRCRPPRRSPAPTGGDVPGLGSAEGRRPHSSESSR